MSESGQMTPKQFEDFITTLKKRGYIEHARELLPLLGISRNTLIKYRNAGTDVKTGLACQAILMGFTEYRGAEL